MFQILETLNICRRHLFGKTRNFFIFAPAGCFIALPITREGGKSGQRRAPCFLTGRSLKGDYSVTENNHPPAGGYG